MYVCRYAAGSLLETMEDGRQRVLLDDGQQTVLLDSDVVHRCVEGPV